MKSQHILSPNMTNRSALIISKASSTMILRRSLSPTVAGWDIKPIGVCSIYGQAVTVTAPHRAFISGERLQHILKECGCSVSCAIPPSHSKIRKDSWSWFRAFQAKKSLLLFLHKRLSTLCSREGAVFRRAKCGFTGNSKRLRRRANASVF